MVRFAGRLWLIFFLLLVLPLTIFLVLNRQEIRKKAAEGTLPPKTASSPGPKYREGEILVKFKSDLKDEVLPPVFESINQKYKIIRATKVFKKDFPRVYKFSLGARGSTKAAIDELSRSLDVEYAEPNYIFKTQLEPNDPYYHSSGSWGQSYSDLWGIKKINSAGAWDQVVGSRSVVVADIDTGIDRNHEDLAANIWTNSGEVSNNGLDDDNNGFIDDYYGWDFVNNDNDPMDDNGHGSHTAGTIAAVGNNSLGVVGVNWQASIMGVKFLDSEGSGTLEGAIQAIKYAADNGARVSSNSYACGCQSKLMEEAIKYAHDLDMVFVAAAGNSNWDALDFSPASSDWAVTVAASDANDAKAYFSNFGEKIDVAAPGVDILSVRAATNLMCTPERTVGVNYCRVSGTSMATPHVAGLAALLLAKDPTFTNEEIRQLIRAGATDLGVVGKDKEFGFGRIEAGNSLLQAVIKPLAPIIISPHSREWIWGGAVEIRGGISGSNFANYRVEIGQGREPTSWTTLATSETQVTDGILASLNTTNFSDDRYIIRLIATDTNGQTYQFQIYDVSIDNFVAEITSPSGWITESNSIEIKGTAKLNGDLVFENYLIDWKEEDSLDWKTTGIVMTDGGLHPVENGLLATWDPTGLVYGKKYNLRLTLQSAEGLSSGTTKVLLYVPEPENRIGWPQNMNSPTEWDDLNTVVTEDLEGDGKKEVIVTTGIDNPASKVFVWDDGGRLLPGWPVDLRQPYIYGPSIGDLNGDGVKEIVIRSWGGGKIFVLNRDGSFLSLWPKEPPTPFYPERPAVLEDLDNNGKMEIIVDQGNGLIHAYKHTGGELPGWPVKVFSRDPLAESLISVGDLDGDLRKEVIVSSPQTNKLYVFKNNGSLLPGWPRTIDKEASLFLSIPVNGDLNGDGKSEIMTLIWTKNTSWLYFWDYTGNVISKIDIGNTGVNGNPALADINKDGFLEVILGDTTGRIHAYKHDGSSLPNFPIINDSCLLFYTDPIVANIDGDNQKEIVFWATTTDYCSDEPRPFLYVFDSDGKIEEGYPKILHMDGSPTISDLDNDKNLELLFVQGDEIHVWNLMKGYREDELDWPEYLHDERHTGAYPIPTPSLPPTPTPKPYGTRINSGGLKYTDTQGKVWVADRAYTLGSFGYVGGQQLQTTKAISGTPDQLLYKNARVGMSAYKFDVPNGDYQVVLKFAEISPACQSAGCRIFDVKIEGQIKLANFDIFAQAQGGYRAFDQTVFTSVSDRQLNIDFIRRKNQPEINAIEIEKL